MAASGGGLFAVPIPYKEKILVTGEKGGKRFTIKLVYRNDSYCLKIVGKKNEVLHIIALDPANSTLATAIDYSGVLASLGDEGAQAALKALAEVMQNIGGKQVILLFGQQGLPGYHAVEDQQHPCHCPLFRHGIRKELLEQTGAILRQYPLVAKGLDEQYDFVSGARSIFAGQDEMVRCQEFTQLLKDAHCIETQPSSYTEEDDRRTLSRLKSEHVLPVAMLKVKRSERRGPVEQGAMQGVVRVLPMGVRFAYLSDDVVKLDEAMLIEIPKEQRARFSLAYLMHGAMRLLPYHSRFVVIAGQGREDIYDGLGFKAFPIRMPGESQHWQAVMHFSPIQGKMMEKMQKQISALPNQEEQAEEEVWRVHFSTTTSPAPAASPGFTYNKS
jgi:hypothetical protein